MEKNEDYRAYTPGSEEIVTKLIEDHLGWATSIARAVARAWNLDWQLDGLDGGAYEGLLFCARRFDPSMGVPFRAYARRRIHEAATEEARKSKSWQRGVGSNSPEEQDAREISATLFNVFPELREGLLPVGFEGDEGDMRSSVRQLLAGANLIATCREQAADNPETLAQQGELLGVIRELEQVHQLILWSVYWNGQSMRNLAEEWKIDELAVIREHTAILGYVFETLADPDEQGKKKEVKKLKVRPGLRQTAQRLRKNASGTPFENLLSKA